MVYNINPKLITNEESETYIHVDYYTDCFSVYTTLRKVSKKLHLRLPEYYTIDYGNSSARVDDVPLSLITRIPIGIFKWLVDMQIGRQNLIYRPDIY